MTTLLVDELRLTYRFVWRDLSASLIPAICLMGAALVAGRQCTVSHLLSSVLAAFGYFGLYIYTFCVANQIAGREEDRLNKPDRPLAAGLVNLCGAQVRLGLALLAFPLVAYGLGGWPLVGFALVWELISASYNWLHLDKHWFTKNVVFISSGSIALLAPAWLLVAPISPAAWRWILVVSVAFGATLQLQDFRDVEGDRATGRKTFPLVFGQRRARLVVSAAIAALPFIIHFALLQRGSVIVRVAELVLASCNWYVAARVLRHGTPEADHHSYMLHTYWYCAVLAAAALGIT